MESQAARRRVKMIAAHLAANEDMSAVATHVFPMVNYTQFNRNLIREKEKN